MPESRNGAISRWSGRELAGPPMKTWDEWHEFWRMAFDRLNRCIVSPNFARLPVKAAVECETRRAEAAVRESVDLVCVGYAETGTWPGMNDTVRWFAMLRVVHAMQLSGALAPNFRGQQVLVPATGITERCMCEWFLVSAWTAGRAEWLPKLVDYAMAAHTPTAAGSN